jgi:hypothetical protein
MATKTATRRTAETAAARKAQAAKPEPAQETPEALAAELAEPGTPEHDNLVAALTEAATPEYAYGVTKFAATKHYLQASGRTPLTLCTGQGLKEVARGTDVQSRNLCKKCATAAETAAPVTVEQINWQHPDRELLETAPTAAKPEPKPEKAEPKPEAKPEASAKPEAAPEPEPVVIVLPDGTTGRMVREWVAEATARGFFTGREGNRYRRVLCRMGAVHTGNTDEAAPENLEYDITLLTDDAALAAHMAKFAKLYPTLDSSTLKGYVRNLGRVLVKYSEFIGDKAAWEKAHPVKAAK